MISFLFGEDRSDLLESRTGLQLGYWLSVRQSPIQGWDVRPWLLVSMSEYCIHERR